jgi:hypothetical protein
MLLSMVDQLLRVKIHPVEDQPLAVFSGTTNFFIT